MTFLCGMQRDWIDQSRLDEMFAASTVHLPETEVSFFWIRRHARNQTEIAHDVRIFGTEIEPIVYCQRIVMMIERVNPDIADAMISEPCVPQNHLMRQSFQLTIMIIVVSKIYFAHERLLGATQHEILPFVPGRIVEFHTRSAGYEPEHHRLSSVLSEEFKITAVMLIPYFIQHRGRHR